MKKSGLWTTITVTGLFLGVVGGCGDDGTNTTGFDTNPTVSTAAQSTEQTATDPTADPTQATSNEPTTTGAPTSDGSTSTGETETAPTSSATTDATTSTPTTDSTTDAPPICGDGDVGDGEECDDGNQDETDECTTVCKSPVCGDGFVQAGEACDDGKQVDTDACLTTCEIAVCGDGVVQDGVEGCDDGNMQNNDECTNACASPKCGDGVVQPGEEDCDDGNAVNTDACTSTCKAAQCGDGFVQAGEECDTKLETMSCDADCTAAVCGDADLNELAGEECDDGNVADADGCEGDCKISVDLRFVFITSELYSGTLGGLTGADAKCQVLADAAGLPGVYKAWLSDAVNSPLTRMTQAAVPYVLPGGTKVADNWADLTDGNLAAAINLTETGGAPPVGSTGCAPDFLTTWTNTSPAGTSLGALSACMDWTSTIGNTVSGHIPAVSTAWTQWCVGVSCSDTSPLICVQQ